MTFYQILCLVGIPSLISSIVAALITSIVTRFKNDKKITDVIRSLGADKLEAIARGTQATLRHQLRKDYDEWTGKGYAPVHVRDDFENCWNNYHNLGANGVMDDIHAKFMALPTEPPEKEKIYE